VNRTTAVALPFVASAAATALAVGVPVGIAHSQELRDTAKPPGLVVDQHARVILSALPKCQQEDGPNPEACVWNVGPQFTRRDGLSLYYRRAGVNDLTRDGRDFRPHYVWNRDPVAGHPHNHWLTRAQRRSSGQHADGRRHRPWLRCYLHAGSTDRVLCPNGDWYSVS
jgi:hypothetical protein